MWTVKSVLWSLFFTTIKPKSALLVLHTFYVLKSPTIHLQSALVMSASRYARPHTVHSCVYNVANIGFFLER